MSDSLNFEQLKSLNPRLGNAAEEAEDLILKKKYRAAMNSLRIYAEILCQTVLKQKGISLTNRNNEPLSINDLIGRIYSQRYRNRTKVGEDEEKLLRYLQYKGNEASHGNIEESPLIVTPKKAETYLEYAWKLSNWYLSNYGSDSNLQATPFRTPLDQNPKFNKRSKQMYNYALGAFKAKNFHLIKGISGSGKTYVAVEEAKRLSKDGFKVLLLVFNEPIQIDLSQRLKGIADVYNYPGYCDFIFREIDPEFRWQNPKKKDEFRYFFEEDLPHRFLLSLKKLKDDSRKLNFYDVIIIDEGQDFHHSWWEGIFELAVDEKPRHFYYFYDPDQNYNEIDINRSLEQLKKITKRVTGREFHEHYLNINLRNTQKIASKMYEIKPLSNKPHILTDNEAPEGDEEPQEEVFSNAKEERKWIKEKLEYIVENKKTTTNNIVIVGLHHFNNSIFSDNPSLGKFKIFNPQDENSEDINRVEYISSRRIKGLEYDYVIVTGFFDPSQFKLNAELKSLLYNSVSRAKQGLYIAYRNRKY